MSDVLDVDGARQRIQDRFEAWYVAMRQNIYGSRLLALHEAVDAAIRSELQRAFAAGHAAEKGGRK